MKSSDIPHFDTLGFDAAKYHDFQKAAIQERMSKFSGRLYLEIGGKFFYDPHAARVLPGFNPHVKVNIFKELASDMDILFCVNARDILANRQLHSEDMDYDVAVSKMLENLQNAVGIRPTIVVNRLEGFKIQDSKFKMIFPSRLGRISTPLCVTEEVTCRDCAEDKTNSAW